MEGNYNLFLTRKKPRVLLENEETLKSVMRKVYWKTKMSQGICSEGAAAPGGIISCGPFMPKCIKERSNKIMGFWDAVIDYTVTWGAVCFFYLLINDYKCDLQVQHDYLK